jgi:DNA helicase-2/ATP-dependent DNA helicase PcrA
VFYVGMSRARERLVLMENLVDGAPTLPIDVLTHNAMTETPFEETLSEIREPAEPEGETGTPQADD